MLMRSEGSEGSSSTSDCDDPLVVIACAAESDACPAACREEAKEDEQAAPKSGSLVVTAAPTSGRKAIRNAVSDLDTLKFKTSEEVSITKVTLERYGYSSKSDIKGVWLEDSDGTIIAESKTLNSKDQVTLSIKKDYRAVDGSYNATIVVELGDADDSSTIGFKVISVESTAEDVDLDDYSPYEYDIVDYTAVSDIALTNKDTTKAYNYEAGEFYQVAKLKVKATSSALTVNGFTLTNKGNLDLEEFLDKVEVLVDGNALKGVSYTVDENELNISFNSYEIAAKGSATFTINMALADFDEYGTYVRFGVAKSSDIRITEKKTGARVTVALPTEVGHCVLNTEITAALETDPYKNTTTPATECTITTTNDGAEVYYRYSDAWSSHTFAGSKIKLSGTKLGNVDAAQGAEDVVVLDGTIELAEAIDRLNFNVVATYSASNDIIDAMRLVIAGEEYEAGKTYTADTTTATFSFSDVEIEKAGKVQILVDIDDDATQNATVKFAFDGATSFNKNVVAGARYTDARSEVLASEVAGGISFASQIKVQASQATLENNLTKTVQYVTDKTTTNTVFDGTYTAKKGNVYLDTVEIDGTYAKNTYGDLTFYVYIDGENVATVDPNEEETFSSVLVKAGESVSVKVEAEAFPEQAGSFDFTLDLQGKDDNDNDAGVASESLATIKYAKAGTVTISSSSTKDTVLLKAKNTELARFTVKPSNSQEGLSLDELKLSINGGLKLDDAVRVKVDGVEYDPQIANASVSDYLINEDIPSEGLDVIVTLRSEVAGDVSLVVTANGSASKTFTKEYADALVYVDSQKDNGGTTTFYFAVEKYDDDMDVTELYLYYDEAMSSSSQAAYLAKVEDGDDVEVEGTGSVKMINAIKYTVVTPTGKTWTLQTVGSCTVSTAHTTEADCTAVDALETATATWSDDSCTVSTASTTEADCIAVNALKTATATWNAAIGKCDDDSVVTEAACTTTVTPVTIKKSQYNDYFRVGDTYAKVFSND